MAIKILALWAVVILCSTIPAQSQYDPLGTDILYIPDDLRRTGSISDSGQKVYIDPYVDPLSIDSLMRPLDPEHTWEYLDKLYARPYPIAYPTSRTNLAGNWQLSLQDHVLRNLQMTLQQNNAVVFGRGTMDAGGVIQDVYVSGTTSGNTIYLDIHSTDLGDYRCAMTIAANNLSGSYYALDSTGRSWTGSIWGDRIL
ncbi:MAG: hypothetical protein EHM14_11815 [Methanothrix sp.]|nr:MAG: hypothetical protein EHM14_11815 [Methanothrix sp.]